MAPFARRPRRLIARDFFNSPTVQRFQVALRTLETAALMSPCASPMISFTPRRLRRVSLRSNLVQIGSASDVPIFNP
jgi:hypothetical protein